MVRSLFYALLLDSLLSSVALRGEIPPPQGRRLLTEKIWTSSRPKARGPLADPGPRRRAGRPATSPSTACARVDERAFAATDAYESFNELHQTVAPLTGGGFAVVWAEGAYSERKIRMQWLDGGGNPLFPPGGKLVAGSADDEEDGVIVADPNGGAFVAFRRGIGSTDIVVQRFDSAGAALWPGDGVPVQAGLTTVGWTVSEPHLVADSTHGVFACFHYWTAGPTLDIRCQHINSVGTRMWTDQGKSACNNGTHELRVLPRAVADDAGGIMVFWRNQGDVLQPSGSMLMEGQRMSPGGEPLWGTMPKVLRTTNLAPDNSYSYVFFEVARDGAGGAVLAFNDWTGESDYNLDVMAQRISASGELLWGAGAVVTGADGHQQHDQTIAAGDGGIFVATTEGFDDYYTSNRLVLYRLGPDGTHVWPQSGLLLSPPGGTANYFGLFGSVDAGVLRAAWTNQLVTWTYEFDAEYASFDLQGARLEHAFLTKAPNGQYTRGLAYSAASGRVLVDWDDERRGDWMLMDVGGALFETTACASCLERSTVSFQGPSNICPGATGGTASVVDEGGENVQHQWGYRIWPQGPMTPIPGRTGTSYTLNATDFPEPNGYLVVCLSTPSCGLAVYSDEIYVCTVDGEGAVPFVSPPPDITVTSSACP